MAAIDQLTGLANVIGAFSDKESTSTTKGSKTTQTKVSDAGISQLIDQILSGAGGVKSIGNAARSSGLYNSTTEQKALGELYSDAAVKAELARSPTVVSDNTTTTTAQEGMGLGSLGSVIGGGMLLNSLFGGASGKGGLGGLLGGTGGAGGGGLGGLLSGIMGGGGAAASGTTGSAIGSLASTLGPESVKMLSGAGGSAAASGGLAAGGTAAGAGAASTFGSLVPYGGAFLGGLLGGQGAGSAKTEDYLGSAASGAAAGFAAGGPMGALGGALLGALGAGSSDMSVICTALNKRGLISNELYKAGHRHLATMDPEVKYGYYIWGIPVADKIDAGSKFWRYAMLVPTWCYLQLMASEQGILDHLENPIGSLLHLVGEPICKLLFRAKLTLKMTQLKRN